MKIGYLAAILKRYKYSIFFFWNMVVISVYIYIDMVQRYLKKNSGGKLVFLGGGSTPYALTEV